MGLKKTGRTRVKKPTHVMELPSAPPIAVAWDVPRAILVFEKTIRDGEVVPVNFSIHNCDALFKDLSAYIRGDACTKEELRALKFSDYQIESADLLKRKNVPRKTDLDELVCRALALGFEFRTPEDEKQLVKSTTFVMRRAPASREFA